MDLRKGCVHHSATADVRTETLVSVELAVERKGRPPKGSAYEAEVARRHADVIELVQRRPDMAWRQVGAATGYDRRTASKIYYRYKGTQVDELSVQEHRERIYGELERIADTLRPWVYDPVDAIQRNLPPPPPRDVLNGLLKVLDKESKLLGTNAPKEGFHHVTRAQVLDVDGEEVTEEELTLMAIECLNSLTRQPDRPEPYRPMTALDVEPTS